jgi:tyrosine-protein phosphatase non-receptor type 23
VCAAKVAAQIVDYYNMALHPLLQGSTDEGTIMDTVSTKLYKSWKKYTKFKATYYSSISLLYQGMQSEEQQKMGERVGYYQAALDKLNEAIKASKGMENTEVRIL